MLRHLTFFLSSVSAVSAVSAVSLIAGAAIAADPKAKPAAQEEVRVAEQFAIHGQITGFGQGYPAFASPYEGPNSLSSAGQIRQTVTATAFFSFRMPWQGELHVNPEYSQGFGINNTLGIAGFTNGDAQKGGSLSGALYPARLYYRHTFGLGSETTWQESGPNQLAGYVPNQRLTFVVGKFAAVDFFQSSAYAGDPRRQFSNWSLWGPGGWDIPADVRGYTQGVVVEAVLSPEWTFRYGALLLPQVPNGADLPIRSDNISHVFETAFSHQITGRPGVIKPFVYYATGAMGRYNTAVANAAAFGGDVNAAMAATRGFGSRKWGFGVLVDQEFADNLGMFFRASWNDGETETFAFTQIDRSFALGFNAKGDIWGKTGHTAGIGFARNDISPSHGAFLAAGGTGLIIGDGQLNRTGEYVMEAFYDLPLYRDNVFLAANYQMIVNPAYNADRSGPVHVLGLRLHARY